MLDDSRSTPKEFVVVVCAKSAGGVEGGGCALVSVGAMCRLPRDA